MKERCLDQHLPGPFFNTGAVTSTETVALGQLSPALHAQEKFCASTIGVDQRGVDRYERDGNDDGSTIYGRHAMKIAVLGAGAGGTTLAFDYAAHGHEVSLFDFPQFSSNIPS